MADAATIAVLIQAKDNASREFKNVENNMGKMVQGIQKHRRAIGMAMTAMGAAITGIAVMSVKSAFDQEKGIRQLDVALQKVGTSYEQQKAQIEAVVAAQQNKTNFGDEEQRDALRELILVSGNYDDAMKALVPTMELAAGKEMDLGAAATLVARAISGEESALNRYGVSVEKGADSTEVLSAIMAKFQGQAEAAADPVTQLKNRAGDLFQVFGTALLPVIETLVPLIEKMVKRMIEWAEAHPTLTKVLGIVVAALGALMLVLGPLLLILPTVVAGIGLVSAAFGVLSVSMGPITLIVLGIAAAITAGMLLWKNWDTVINAVKKTITFFAKSALDMARDVLVAIKAVADFIPGLKGTEDALQGAINKLDDMSGNLDKWADNTEGKLRETSQAWGALEDSHHSNTQSMQNQMEDTAITVTREHEKISEAAEDLAIASGNAWGEIQDDWIEGEKIIQESAQRQADSVAYFAKLNLDTERAARNESRENYLKDIEDNLAAAARQQEEKARILDREAQDVERAADRKADAEQRALDRQLSSWERFQQDQHPIMQALDDRNMRFGEVLEVLAKDAGISLGDMGERVKQAGGTWGDTFALINDAVSSNLESILATIETTGARAASSAVVIPAVAAAALDTGAGQPGAHMGGGSVSAGQIASAVERWNARMPHSPVGESTLKSIASIQQHGGDLADLGGIYEQIVTGIPGRSGTGIQGFANGGRVGRGGMALVGERGAELVSVPGGATVHPNGTGPGGVTNQFHFHGAVYGVEDLKEAVVEAVRDHAISGGFSGVFAEA